MTGRPDQSDGERLREEAAAWLVRVQSDAAADGDWAALAEWLEASDAHRMAFEDAELLSAEIDDHAADIARALSAPPAQVIAFADHAALSARARATAPRRRLPAFAALAAALVALAGTAGWIAWYGQETVYRTGTGQTRQVALADGTHIRLNAASTMKVRLGMDARRVELGDAEATFDVAHDPERPFLISVGDQQVRVVGTEFNVRHYDSLTVVTVRRGVVEVRQRSAGSRPIARLTVGQSLTHEDGAPVSTQASVSPSEAFAWTEGRLVCDDRPLSEIVAYLNRRYPVPIRISDAAGQRRFSGVLELGDEDAVVRRIAGFLSLSVERTERGIALR
jgi:transmembrane sensor